MAAPDDSEQTASQGRHAALTNGEGRGRTKILGVLVAVMVLAGVVALVMTLFGNDSDSSQAASQPSGSQVGHQSSAAVQPSSATSTAEAPTSSAADPATSAPATTSAPAKPKATTKKSSGSAGSATKVVKYTVKSGDNLTLIAKWFNQRGYGLVYDWNKSVIGQNPDLIHPGQTIIVSLTGDKMNVSTGSK